MKQLKTLILILCLAACDNVKTESVIDTDIKADNHPLKLSRKDVFAEIEKQREYLLFLDFWGGMSRIEFNIVQDSLVENQTFSRINNKVGFYIITDSRPPGPSRAEKNVFELQPVFYNDSLVEVNLNPVELGSKVSGISKVDGIRGYCNHPIVDMYKLKYGTNFVREDEGGFDFISKRTFRGRYSEVHFKSAELVTLTWERKNTIVKVTIKQKLNLSHNPAIHPDISLESFSISYLEKNHYNDQIQRIENRKQRYRQLELEKRQSELEKIQKSLKQI